MKRAIKRILARTGLVLCSVMGLLQPATVSALGLGEMEVTSFLYERFDASIPIISQTRVDPAQLKVTLASAEEFRRAGISRPYYLTTLKYELVYSNGRNKLLVTSPDVLREPFLNVLLEVRWPSGKMLKEYTVFVDPRSSQSSSRQSTSSASASSPSATASNTLTPAYAAPQVPVVTNRLTQSEVAPAKKFQGSAADLLPSAKERVTKATTSPADDYASKPDSDDVDSNPSEETEGYYSADLGSDYYASDNTQKSSESYSEKLAASAEIDAGAGAVVEGADGRQLQSDLAQSLENLDKAKIENEQLEERIQSVESQVEDFERLIELKNKEIDAVTESIELKQADQEAAQTAVSSTSKGNKSQVAKGLFGLSTNILLLIVGGIVLLLILLWLFVRGRKDEYAATIFNESEGKAESVVSPEPALRVVEENEARQQEDDVLAEEENLAADDLVAGSDEVLDFDELESEQSAEDPDDPLAEADIYMAYGRHGQAVSMLKRAIDDEPQRTDLRLKLLEVLKDEGTLDENTYLVETQRQRILSDAPELEAEINAVLGAAGIAPTTDSDPALSLDVELDSELTDLPSAETTTSNVDSEALVEEVATKLELAHTYFDMGDFNGAKEMLLEVVEEGSAEQKAEAQSLLEKIA